LQTKMEASADLQEGPGLSSKTGIGEGDLLNLYIHEIGRYRLLTRSEENYLGRRIEQGSSRAKERLVLSNLKLVVSVAKQYSDQTQGLSLLDLIQEGNIGLLKAVERFDQNKGYKFSTYATWWIKQRVRRAVIDKGETIRIPVHTYEIIRNMKRLERERREEGKPPPDREEVAEELDVSISTVKRAERAAQSQGAMSLDKPLTEEEDGVLGDFLPDREASSPEKEALRDLISDQLAEAMEDKLDDRERKILELRYGLRDGEAHSLAQIGEVVDLTRERVRQIENEALEKLRSPQILNYLGRYHTTPENV